MLELIGKLTRIIGLCCECGKRQHVCFSLLTRDGLDHLVYTQIEDVYGRRWLPSDLDDTVVYDLSQVNQRHEAILGRMFTSA